MPREKIAVPRVPGGHHAVEEVHAAMHTLKNVLRRTDAHQVPRLVLRHVRLHRLDDPVHFFRFLPDRKPADRVAGAVDFADLFHVPDAQILIGAALVDPEEHLLRIDGDAGFVQTVQFFPAAEQPADRAVAGLLHVVVLCRILDALVKRHRDCGAEMGLNAHAFLRTHEDPLAVDVGREIDALFLDPPETG